MIAFLGTGLLGANFVRALRSRGEAVQVWNRTATKARALEAVGAKAFDTPADAVRGADRIHLTLADDASVDEALERAAGSISPHCLIVDHTTTAPDPTAERVARWAERGIRFQHAPVFMGPSNALDGSGTMLASGDRTLFDTLVPALEPMTGKLVYLGPDPVRATTVKLMGNLFLVALSAGLADMFALGDAYGVPTDEGIQIFDWFNMATMAAARARRLRSGDVSQPSWTLAMARKDVRLMNEATEARGGELVVMPAIAAAMDRLLAAGHSGDDFMVIGRAPRSGQ
ncbi:MAG: NAD(P)-binding domain-containing protein [Gemmatimonadota bacterium]